LISFQGVFILYASLYEKTEQTAVTFTIPAGERRLYEKGSYSLA
jgi:hypothetical protein